jgi:hypothetical protein
MIVFSAEEVKKLGKDSESVAKFEDDFSGFGDSAYMAQMGKFSATFLPIPQMPKIALAKRIKAFR